MKRTIGLGLLVLSFACLAGSASADQRCAGFTVRAKSWSYRLNVTADRVSCKTATKIVRAFFLRRGTVQRGHPPLNTTYWTLKRYPGWRCAVGAGGGCTHKRQSASYSVTEARMAAVLSCAAPAYGHGPRNDREVNLGGVSARNMTCTAARRAISNGRLVLRPGFVTHGFRCRVLSHSQIGHGSGAETTGQTIRCTSGRRAFRFSWAT